MIVWSGGCDSTLVLYDALVEAKDRAKNNSWSWPVVTISIAHDGVPAIAEQRAARQAIFEDLKARGYRWKHSEVDVKVRGAGPLAWTNGLSQPQIWLSIASSFLGNHEPLITGWHEGDHVWSRIAEVRTLFDALQTIANRDGKLETPLEHLRKAEIITRLKTAKLYDHTWFCERPEAGKACNVRSDATACLPCRTHALALYEITTFARGKSTKASAEPGRA